MKSIVLIDNDEIQRIDNDMDELISKNIKQVKVRDTMLDIEHDKAIYNKKGIVDTSYDNPENLIDIPSLIRYLDEKHLNLFRATDKELRTYLPSDLPKLMQIDSWHQETYTKFKHMTSPTTYEYQIMGKKPSDYETYKIIADILVTKDTTKWKPKLKLNNNWRNWPNAGYM